MNRKKLLTELEARGIQVGKVIFHAISPYRKRRYKPEFVGWEAWLYNGKSNTGFLLTQEDYENKDYLKTYLEAFSN